VSVAVSLSVPSLSLSVRVSVAVSLAPHLTVALYTARDLREVSVSTLNGLDVYTYVYVYVYKYVYVHVFVCENNPETKQ